MNLLAKPVMYGLTVALLGSLVFGGWQCSQKQTARTEAADARAELATDRESAAKALARFEEMARQQEHRHAADMDRIAQEYLEELSNAKAESDRVVADLRSGAIRLQDRWRGCGEPSPVPDLDAGTRAPDAVTIDREQGAADLVHAARACDAQVKGLQAIIRKDRGQ